MVALHKRILLGMVRLTDLDLDAQTRAKTEQGRRKITACWTAHPARIAIQGDQLGPTILGQAERQGLQSRFCREIGAHMRIEQHRGSHIDDVERLDPMLPLAIGIGRHETSIFEIDLPARHGRRALPRLMEKLATLSYPLMGFEEAINGLARWYRHLEELQQGIAVGVVVEVLVPRAGAQAFGRMIADGKDV